VASTPLAAGALEPQRSFQRLVTSNGWAVASYDRLAARVDTFLERPYRFRSPRGPAADLCFAADESRDLAHDLYFGLRSGARGDWLPALPLGAAGYLPGTGVIATAQDAGEQGAWRVETFTFMPMEVAGPVLVMLARVENRGDSSQTASVYTLFNFHLGEAGGGRDPSADGEEVAWDATRATFYEYGPSQGTMAYTGLTAVERRTVSTGEASVYRRLQAAADLDNVSATAGPTDDVAPGFQSPPFTLAPGQVAWVGVAVTWALDEDAAPDVDMVNAWAAGRTPQQLLDAEVAGWEAWHTEPPAGLDDDQRVMWRQQAALLRMSQVREPAPSHGQVLASLPPGLGNIHAQWNITWVRDMAYAVVGFARAGHLAEARDALAFQVGAGPGRHTAAVGRPYRLSVTRYFGDGQEESDCNEHGPNIEFDGFGLFLWSLGEYLRAGGDVEAVRPWWPVIRDEVADVLVSLVGPDGVVKADSSIWEVHWNGQQRKFTYTSLAAARGLCDAAEVATRLGQAEDAARYAAAGAGVRDAVVARHTDAAGVLSQSAEDLAAGTGYLDAATVEAVNWGIVSPTGRVANATLDAMAGHLVVPSGMGFMRNDDSGWYDSQEWVFVDLRLVPALRSAGRRVRAESLLSWVEGQARVNDFQVAELHDATTGAYAGSIPMAGFGAGAYLVALSGDALPAACGSYAVEPGLRDAGPGPGDAGGGADSGGARDAAVTVDAATGRDAAATPDGAGTRDAATAPDAAQATDAAVVTRDASVPSDAAPGRDGAAPPADAATGTPDGPARSDGGPGRAEGGWVPAERPDAGGSGEGGPCGCVAAGQEAPGFAWLATGLLAWGVTRATRRRRPL
jgi:GH15 family glucan-1,4-alpha-glucosidase